MSSRFVSGGAIDPTSGQAVEAPGPGQRGDDKPVGKNQQEWEAVSRELEEEKRRREESRAKEAAGEQQSLYDILQANKAAKQAAFEEKTKISNQFRALDDDEIEFLDEVRQAKRAEEERLRRETEEGLKAFREAQRGGAEATAGDEGRGDADVDEDWAAGRKRKRTKEKEGLKLVKRRVSEGGAAQERRLGEGPEDKVKSPVVEDEGKKKNESRTPSTSSAAPTKPKLGGLVDYGSDDDDDDD